MRSFTTVLILLLSTNISQATDPRSGLRPGDEVEAWEPIHVAGPHAGTRVCPVCTYLDAPVLLAFASNPQAAAKLATPLEDIAKRHKSDKLKVLLVVMDGSDGQLRALAKEHGIQYMMFCRLDPERRASQLKAYQIDPSVANTIMLYQDYHVRRTWSGLAPADLIEVKTATDAYLRR